MIAQRDPNGADVTPNQTNAEGAFKGATDGQELPDFIREQFEADPDLKWRELERLILIESDGACRVSHVTLPRWYGDLQPEASAA